MHHGIRGLESQGPSGRRWERLLAKPTSRRLAAGAILSVGLVAAACGSSTGSAVSNTSNAGAKAATVAATVIGSTTNPTLGTILVNASGATLYRFTADQKGQSSCTGACAQLWLPFTVTGGSQPKAASGIVGVFGTSKRADGTTQVTYNGSPLYTFTGDKTAGSTAGQGVLGMWFVVNVSATPVAAPATTVPGSNTTTTRAPSTPAVTPTTAAQPAPTSPAPTSPAPTSPPATSPPPTSPPPTSPPPTSPSPTSPPPPPTTTPTTMAYGY